MSAAGISGLRPLRSQSKLGLQVVLVEMADRILQRVAAPETSDFFRDASQSSTVSISVKGSALDHLTGDGAVSGAVLSDGTELDLDFVIVGVGIAPGTALAEAAGIEIDNGIATDTARAAHLPPMYGPQAIVRPRSPYRGGRIRLESVPNAIDQAECVAENILGRGTKTMLPVHGSGRISMT